MLSKTYKIRWKKLFFKNYKQIKMMKKLKHCRIKLRTLQHKLMMHSMESLMKKERQVNKEKSKGFKMKVFLSCRSFLNPCSNNMNKQCQTPMYFTA